MLVIAKVLILSTAKNYNEQIIFVDSFFIDIFLTVCIITK